MARSFSIIVPVLNKENEIIRSLESIEASIHYFYQHHAAPDTVEVEVLVINEGSTDRTLEYVTEFSRNKPHYQLITHFKSLGIGPARNTGAKLAKGDILFFCDGDDLVFPEHFYLCFKVLTHTGTTDENSFLLTSDRGTFTIALPPHPVGMIRTGVHLKDQLHPYWKGAVENTIMQNLAIRRVCHDFVEGFPEAPVYKQIGCEDISYDLWTVKFFKLLKIELETVEYIRYPGNNLDRQLKKFQTAPENYQEEMPAEQRDLHAVRRQLEQDRLKYLLNKFRRLEKSSEFLQLVNWQALAAEYLNQQHYLDVVTLCEQGLAIEPVAIDNIRNLLAVAYNNLGSACHQRRELAEATHYFKQAIAMNPAFAANDLARIHFNVSTVLKDQGFYAEALGYLEGALALDAQLKEAIALLPSVQYQVETTSKGYQFHQDTFSKNTVLWEQMLPRLANQANLKVLEIGHWQGQSTCWLLDHLLTHESARLTYAGACDLEARSETQAQLEHQFCANLAKTGKSEKVRILSGKPQDILRSLIPNSYHLVYFGGSSAATEILEITMLTWGLVQVGGIMIFNPYETPPAMPEPSPKAAIDAWLQLFAAKLKILSQGTQLFVEKTTV